MHPSSVSWNVDTRDIHAGVTAATPQHLPRTSNPIVESNQIQSDFDRFLQDSKLKFGIIDKFIVCERVKKQLFIHVYELEDEYSDSVTVNNIIVENSNTAIGRINFDVSIQIEYSQIVEKLSSLFPVIYKRQSVKMKFLLCLLITLGVTYGAILPFKPNCANMFCSLDLKICPDGSLAPIPVGGCCPSLSACKTVVSPIESISDCGFSICSLILLLCPDGRPAPIPTGQCCPSLSACSLSKLAVRSNPLSSLLSGSNLLQSLSTATHGTNLGTALSIINLLNNVQQLSNDVHQIPILINQTLASILNGTGQAGQIIINQLIGAVSNIAHPNAASRNLLDSLGQNANLLSSISHLLPQGTSISTVLSILNLLNNVNALNNDIHQIPTLLNQTLASIFAGAGQAGQVVVQQLLNLVGSHPQPASRNLFESLGQNANLLSSISHLLPQGTSISTVLSILNLLNNVNALNGDLHQIPVVLQETLQNLVNGITSLLPPTVQSLQGSA
ncbi:unnamed protein product [Rotaria socialis]|uniref:Uncharacterized protein n=2 Tax=Rotaria socialis TaxID=392032 RepID=A0A817SM72_9BILA|nr:unnamed protein product [Rotaria socialis]